MFKRRTVFIIGAGCSHDYGFPQGRGLIERICETLNERRGRKLELIKTAAVTYGNYELNCHLHHISPRFAQGIQHWPSIDQYLDHHKDNQALVDLGKIAIACEILHCEAECILSDDPVLEAREHRWLDEMFKLMLPGTSAQHPTAILQNVTFLTFNYDRLIELYLLRGLHEAVHLPMGEARKLIRDDLVLHAYGSVGRIDGGQPGISHNLSATFSKRAIDDEAIKTAARQLQTFTEGSRDNELVEEMKTALSSAQQIVFLGFSYLDDNMRLMSLADGRTAAEMVFGTVYRVSSPDVAAARHSIASSFPQPLGTREEYIKLEDRTAFEFLKKYGGMFTRASLHLD
jgi:hypothetical protein